MSAVSLFEHVGEYREAAERLADLDLPPEVIADTLEGLTGDVEVKSRQVAMFTLGLEATADAIKAHREAQKAREDAIRRRAEHLREYLANCMQATGIERIEGPGVVLSWRKSSAVVIDEPGLLPAEFLRQKPPPEPEPNKSAIAEAIKSGREVAGARIEQRRNLQIR